LPFSLTNPLSLPKRLEKPPARIMAELLKKGTADA